MAADRGFPWTALPVFLHRRFRHGFVFVNRDAGIATPKDLIGRRVGGTNFTPAGTMWIRGILEEEHGVPHKELTWVTERDEDIDFEPAPGLRLERVDGSRNLDEMLASGELPAMISPDFPRAFLRGDRRIARLFPDHKEREIEYYRRTGIFPIMHVTVIRKDIVERHPWVAASMMTAFDEAKRIAYERVRNPRVVPLAWFRSAWEKERTLLGDDPGAYGLGAANRKNLEAAIRHTHRQSLIKRPMDLAGLFVDTDEEALKKHGGY